MRLDLFLVHNKNCLTRSKAKQLIESGSIKVNGKVLDKCNFECTGAEKFEIDNSSQKYVSRAGLKLEKALIVFNVDLMDKFVVDIGCSTGGFTDCALKHGAKHVYAIDVGTKQFSDGLVHDDRITLYENTDFRLINNNLIKKAEIAVIDLSFISLTKIIDKLASINSINSVICLIKPQFECGAELAKKFRGVIKDKKIHKNILFEVINCFYRYNFCLSDLDYSPILGGDGNIEFIAKFDKMCIVGKEYNLEGSIKARIDNVVNDAHDFLRGSR